MASIKGKLKRSLVGTAAAPGLAALFLAGCGSAPQTTGDRPLGDARLAAQSQPAVVLVVDDMAAKVTVPAPSPDVARLEQEFKAAVQAGQVTPDQEQDFIGQQFLANPLAYLIPGDQAESYDAKAAALGSGFIVTPDGYIVTNAHVVLVDDQDRAFLVHGSEQQYVQDTFNGFEQSIGGQQLPPDIVQRLQDAFAKFYEAKAQLGEVRQSVYAGGAVAPNGLQGQIVATGQEYPRNDVAVIKVQQHDLPTLSLGDDSSVNLLDPLYAIGYPAAAGVNNPTISRESYLVPTLTRGELSARKTTTTGTPVLQMSTDVTHGNSGGPVLDRYGRVAGMSTAGSMDDQGNQVQGFNFALPASVIRQFLNSANVHPKESQATSLFKQGLDAADQQHYSQALQLFQKVNTLDPGIPAVQDQMKSAQTAIDQGRDQPVDQGSGLPLLAVGIALMAVKVGVVITALGGALLGLLRRRRRPRAGAPVGPQPEAMPLQLTGHAVTPAVAVAATPAPMRGPRFCTECGSAMAGQHVCPACARPAA